MYDESLTFLKAGKIITVYKGSFSYFIRNNFRKLRRLKLWSR